MWWIERGRGRLAVGAGDADDLVRRKLGPGAGEQLDVADDLDAGLAGALRDRVAVEREAGRDDEAVELGEVGFVEVGDASLLRSGRPQREGAGELTSNSPSPSSLRGARSFARASSFASHAVTFAPLASSASTVAKPDRARP